MTPGTVQATARVLDLLASSVALGATVWFFFVQSPVLLKRMGREAFVPLQMALAVVFFRTVSVAAAIVVAATALQDHALTSRAVITAALALASSLINQVLVVPRALRAGGASRKELKGKDAEGSTAKFASEGAGRRTALLHRLVVLWVVALLVALVLHVA